MNELKQEGIDCLESVAKEIENDWAKELFYDIINDFPEYIWSVPASSTGKYHPTQDLGPGGLIRHMTCAGAIINYKFNLEYFRNLFTSEERDCIRIAALVHDGRKSGETNSGSTMFEHPILMKDAIEKFASVPKYTKYKEQIQQIGQYVLCHMGQWNTSKDGLKTLPKPQAIAEILVAEADYLSSRKSMTMDLSKI